MTEFKLLPGPTYLAKYTTGVDNPKKLLPFEWRMKLKSSAGNTKFAIYYYGQLHKTFKTLIVGTDFAPALVIAKDITDGEEIVIFDGCKHGFNAMFGDEYSNEQINNRDATNHYGNDSFEIVISAYYQTEFEEELEHLIDENGFVQLVNGSKIEFETVKRNAFDVLQIIAINDKGREINIVEEELA